MPKKKSNRVNQAGLTFDTYKKMFKKMLVCRYNWLVSKAHQYNCSELKKHFENELTIHQSYFKIFKVEQDFQSI